MDFKLVTKASGWQGLVSAVNIMNEEAVFRISKDGILLKAVSGTNVEMVVCQWSKEKFTSFNLEIGSDDHHDFAFRVSEFYKIVNRFKKDEEIIITNIKDVGLQVTSKNKKFEMAKINTEMPDIPTKLNIKWEINFEKETTWFKELLKDLKVMGDSVRIVTEDKKIIFSCRGDAGKVENYIIQDDVKQGIDNLYSSEYIGDVIDDLAKFSTKVRVRTAHEKAIWLAFEVDGIGTIDYYLAPRMK